MQTSIRHNSKRSGATLIEVLMALMIFSVAITSVIALFPIAYLSSLRATQLTNSKILAENVVEQVRSNPALLRPWFDTAALTWQGEWEPGTVYNVGDVVSPTIEPGRLSPVPPMLYRCTGFLPTGGNRSGIYEPDWAISFLNPVSPPAPPPPVAARNEVFDGDVIWQLVVPPNATRSHVVDPLGQFLPSDTQSFQWFGFDSNSGNLNPVAGTPAIPGVHRTSGPFASFAGALDTFGLPDSWSVFLEDVPVGLDLTTPNRPVVTFSTSVDLSGLPVSPNPGTAPIPNNRLVLVGLTGQRTVVRNIVRRNGQSLELDRALPEYMNNVAAIRTVRLEDYIPRYTYIMTVRDQQPGLPFNQPRDLPPEVTVVLFFNRSFDPSAEEVYLANFCGEDDDPTTDGFTGVQAIERLNMNEPELPPDVVRVAWSSDPTQEPKPLIRENNYLFDARNVIWYKIVHIGTETTAPGGGFKRVDITVDRPIEIRTRVSADPNDAGRVMFLPGIVQLFEL